VGYLQLSFAVSLAESVSHFLHPSLLRCDTSLCLQWLFDRATETLSLSWTWPHGELLCPGHAWAGEVSVAGAGGLGFGVTGAPQLCSRLLWGAKMCYHFIQASLLLLFPKYSSLRVPKWEN